MLEPPKLTTHVPLRVLRVLRDRDFEALTAQNRPGTIISGSLRQSPTIRRPITALTTALSSLRDHLLPVESKKYTAGGDSRPSTAVLGTSGSAIVVEGFRLCVTTALPQQILSRGVASGNPPILILGAWSWRMPSQSQ